MLLSLCPTKGQIQDSIIDSYPGLDPNWGWKSFEIERDTLIEAPWYHKEFQHHIEPRYDTVEIDPTFSGWPLDIDSIDWKTIPIYSSGKPLYPIPVHEITLQDLLDYQKECYDDSTQTSIESFTYQSIMAGYRFIPDKNFWINDYKKLERTEEYNPPDYFVAYVHKIPTFEGFIEYMKRKYKIMEEKTFIYNNEIKDKDNDCIKSYDVFSILQKNPALIDDFINAENTK